MGDVVKNGRLPDRGCIMRGQDRFESVGSKSPQCHAEKADYGGDVDFLHGQHACTKSGVSSISIPSGHNDTFDFGRRPLLLLGGVAVLRSAFGASPWG